MAGNIAIKSLKPSDIRPQMLVSFSHKQVISDKWVKDGGRYELIKSDEIREWSREKRVWISQYLTDQIVRGGFAVGAFYDDRIIGFSSIDGIVRGETEKYVNLTMLFVDDNWQRKGIGGSLFRQTCLCAQKTKADKIFISAIPSYDTISFYFRMGCSDAAYIIDDFVDTEHDRYLEFTLKNIE